MSEQEIRYTDGAAYERTIGKWGQLAGESFFNWLAPSPSLSWIDVGVRKHAFTELLIERCAPRAIVGIDPASDSSLRTAGLTTSLRTTLDSFSASNERIKVYRLEDVLE